VNKRRGQGEGGIHQRPDGRWEARLDIGWVEGKRKRISVYGRTRKEVADILRKKQDERDKRLLVLDQRLTVGSWLDHWVESILPTRVSNGALAQSTFSNYADTVRLHLKPQLGRIRLARLNHADVDAFIAAKRGRYAPNSLRLMRSTLRKALADAERAGLVARNAVALSEPIHVSLRASEWLDQKKARSLLQQVRGDRLEALYIVCLHRLSFPRIATRGSPGPAVERRRPGSRHHSDPWSIEAAQVPAVTRRQLSQWPSHRFGPRSHEDRGFL
jgi:hypothetical protein